MFLKLWGIALEDYDELKGFDWSWQSMDGAMTKAPLGGEKNRPKSYGQGQKGVKRSLLTEGSGVPVGLATDGANRHDGKMAKATVKSIPVKRPKPTKRKNRVCALTKVMTLMRYETW